MNISKTEKFYFSKRKGFIYSFLIQINNEYSNSDKEIKKLIYRLFQENIHFKDSFDNNSYFELLKELDLSKLKINEEEIIDKYLKQSSWIDDIEYFENFKEVFPTTYIDAINSEIFVDKANEIIDNELENIEDSEAGEIKNRIENIQNNFNLDFEDHIHELEKRNSEMEDYIDHQINMERDYEKEYDREDREDREEDIIDEIFNSLKE